MRMRTTLDIDDDVLLAAKDLAKDADKTAGKIISELVRKALTQPNYVVVSEPRKAEGGIAPLPSRVYVVGDIESLPHRGGIVTTEMVRRLMDEEGV
jgi:hypothetical protein